MSVQINNIVIPFIQIPQDFEYEGFYEDDDDDVEIYDYEDDFEEDYEEDCEEDEDYEDEEDEDEIF